MSSQANVCVLNSVILCYILKKATPLGVAFKYLRFINVLYNTSEAHKSHSK